MSEIPFPHEPAVHDGRTPAESRMTPGAFARDPDRFGPPFEPTADNPKLLVFPISGGRRAAGISARG